MTVLFLAKHQSNLSIDGCLASCHLPHTNQAVSITSEKGVAICCPCERDARCWQSLRLGVGHGKLELELVDNALALEVPKHGNTVLATRCTQGAIRRHRHSVDVARVPLQVLPELAVGQLPHLDELVPPTRDDKRVRSIR